MHPEKDQKTKPDVTAKDEQAPTKGFNCSFHLLLFMLQVFKS